MKANYTYKNYLMCKERGYFIIYDEQGLYIGKLAKLTDAKNLIDEHIKNTKNFYINAGLDVNSCEVLAEKKGVKGTIKILKKEDKYYTHNVDNEGKLINCFEIGKELAEMYVKDLTSENLVTEAESE